MESLFENITEYSKDLYDKYIKFHSRKYGVQELIFYIFALVLLVILTIRGVQTLKWKMIVIWIAVFAIIYINRKRVFKSKEQYKTIVRKRADRVKYIFYDKYFETLYQGEVSKVSYFEIKKVFELSDRYYLYLDKSHACIILKYGFTKGEEEEFRAFLDTKGLFRIKKVKKY